MTGKKLSSNKLLSNNIFKKIPLEKLKKVHVYIFGASFLGPDIFSIKTVPLLFISNSRLTSCKLLGKFDALVPL